MSTGEDSFNKSAFIRANPTLTANEIVALALEQGQTIKPTLVYNVRGNAKKDSETKKDVKKVVAKKAVAKKAVAKKAAKKAVAKKVVAKKAVAKAVKVAKKVVKKPAHIRTVPFKPASNGASSNMAVLVFNPRDPFAVSVAKETMKGMGVTS